MTNKFKIITFSLLAGLFVLQSCSEKEEEKKEEEYLPLVNVFKAERKTFEHKIQVQGNVETDQDVLLNAEMGGLVTRVHVSEGQAVRAGQLLVSLDAAMVASNANEIKTQLSYAEYMLGKQLELKNRGVGSEFDYEAAKSQVDALKSRLRSLNTQQGKSSITAPFSGVIDQIFARDGQSVGPQNPLMRLVNNNNIDITADISEKHFSAVKVGTLVEVSFPNYNDTIINLVVNTVGQYIEPVNRTFNIVSRLNNNRVFLPNMLAELSITDMEVPNALVIKSAGIIKDQQNKDFIYVATKTKGDKYSVRKVSIEVIEKYKGEAYVRVIGGALAAGDLVITEGAKGITEKDTVRIK
jgi:RND family efflux transporter MFP subunit